MKTIAINDVIEGKLLRAVLALFSLSPVES